jgi:hypothetical protein
MPQKSYHHQQYDKICISYSFKDPTEKGLNASEKLQHVPKERSQKIKMGHKNINVTYPDNTPFGWAFDNFYDAVIGHGIVVGNISRKMSQFAKLPIADVRFDLKSNRIFEYREL